MFDTEGSLGRVKNTRSHNVCRQEIGSELNTLKLGVHHTGNSHHGQCFGDSGNSLQQNMRTATVMTVLGSLFFKGIGNFGKETHQEVSNHLLLPDDDPVDLLFHLPEELYGFFFGHFSKPVKAAILGND